MTYWWVIPVGLAVLFVVVVGFVAYVDAKDDAELKQRYVADLTAAPKATAPVLDVDTLAEFRQSLESLRDTGDLPASLRHPASEAEATVDETREDRVWRRLAEHLRSDGSA